MATEMTKPRISLLSLSGELFFYDNYASLLAKIKSKADLQRIEDAGSALRLLSEPPPPSAVIITDEALTLEENAYVLEAILWYVRRGGKVVIMSHFSLFEKLTEIKPFFATAGVHWVVGPYYRTPVVLNQATVGDSLAMNIPPQYGQNAQFLGYVAPEDAEDVWYRVDENSLLQSLVFAPTNTHIVGGTPISLTRIGRGDLGYVGDVNRDEGSDTVALAMCGLFHEDHAE
ncbi:hypothetical protein GGR58DRAFT_505362 [Xylaria digitata]|nr:hypothetical protein GGR58DRAFT_505362 [Xylaria digitata]